MNDKINHGMLAPPTRKITESVRTAIVITKTRDKLPLVHTAGMIDPPNALNTLGKVRNTTATGAHTGAAMNMNTTMNARRVMGAMNTGPPVASTRGFHIDAEMKVLRVTSMDKGRRPMSMGGMKAPRTGIERYNLHVQDDNYSGRGYGRSSTPRAI
jgi:hypothetical protein